MPILYGGQSGLQSGRAASGVSGSSNRPFENGGWYSIPRITQSSRVILDPSWGLDTHRDAVLDDLAVSTGGGTLFAETTNRNPTLVISGGGSTVPTVSGAHNLADLLISGGGSTVPVSRKGVLQTIAVSGGGAMLFAVRKGALLGLLISSGGGLVFTYQVVVGLHKTATLQVSGGGSVIISWGHGGLRAWRGVSQGSYTDAFGDTPPKTFKIHGTD